MPASDWTERHRPRIAASLLLPGGMSTSTADSEVRAAFRAMLSAERAGYKLAVALVSTLVSYLVGTAELSDVSELDMSTFPGCKPKWNAARRPPCSCGEPASGQRRHTNTANRSGI